MGWARFARRKSSRFPAAPASRFFLPLCNSGRAAGCKLVETETSAVCLTRFVAVQDVVLHRPLSLQDWPGIAALSAAVTPLRGPLERASLRGGRRVRWPKAAAVKKRNLCRLRHAGEKGSVPRGRRGERRPAGHQRTWLLSTSSKVGGLRRLCLLPSHLFFLGLRHFCYSVTPG